ncbi:TMAO reductase system periplasmic protein TorT [Leisingera caerulea]|uniref:TMAO reductase system periplasmic protein TorT n=1 Tax=Leisingera caerulea TaxID=506591 RepID=UPI0021A27FE3|nr:TMAO reductase system periplasmic protein TorT [Leisingera caerulea]UWQ86004.1 TMAO reductase system periplasmic protein TorT [Leisingera caerulea]
MAERIWISRVSNLVRRIVRHYGAASAGSIAAIGLCVALCSSAAASSSALFCVLVPHFKDEYWLSVGYGLEQEAARQNVELLFFEAGGYRARAKQIEQLGSCTKRRVDAILIGAVTSDHPDLTEAIAQAARNVPVFGLVNELHADGLSGRIGVNWHEMGYAVGRYLAERHPEGSPLKTAVFISGPPEAGWTSPLETGLRDGLAGGAVAIIEVFGADTGLRQQLALVETALDHHPNADYLIGSAPAVEAAIGLLATKADPNTPLLLSTYISHTIMRGLMNGGVLATAFDDPVLQGVMALNQAVSVLASERSVEVVGPDIVLLTNSDKNLVDIRISPPEYFPDIH